MANTNITPGTLAKTETPVNTKKVSMTKQTKAAKPKANTKRIKLGELSLGGSGAKQSSISYGTKMHLADKVEGVVQHGSDPYEILAQNQTTANKVSRTMGAIAPSLVAKTVNGVGFVGGGLVAGALSILDYVADDITTRDERLAIMNDNFVAKAGHDVDSWIKDSWIPVYKTQEYKDSTNALYKVFAEGATGLGDGISFMGSAMLAGGVLNKLKLGKSLVKQISKANRLTKAGKLAEAQSVIDKAKQVSTKMAKGAKDTKTLSSPISSNASGIIARNHEVIGKAADYATIHAYNTISESAFEAYETRHRAFEDNVWTTGKDGQLLDEQQVKDKQFDAWHKSFTYNLALLAVTNIPETVAMAKIFSKVKLSKARAKKFANISNSKAAKYGYLAKGAAVSAGSEGLLEEGGQMAIEKFAMDEEFDSNPIDALPEIFNNWLANFSTVEGQEAMITGALIGFIPGAAGNLADQMKNREMGQFDILSNTIYKSDILKQKQGVFKTNDKGEFELDDNNNLVIDEVKAEQTVALLKKQDSDKAALLANAVTLGSKALYNHVMQTNFISAMRDNIGNGYTAASLNEDIDFHLQETYDAISAMAPSIEQEQQKKELDELKQTYQQMARAMVQARKKANGMAYSAQVNGLITEEELDGYADQAYDMEVYAVTNLATIRDFSLEVAGQEDTLGLTKSRDYNRKVAEYKFAKRNMTLARGVVADTIKEIKELEEKIKNTTDTTEKTKLKDKLVKLKDSLKIQEEKTSDVNKAFEAKKNSVQKAAVVAGKQADKEVKEEDKKKADKNVEPDYSLDMGTTTFTEEQKENYEKSVELLSALDFIANKSIEARRMFDNTEAFKKHIDGQRKASEEQRAKDVKVIKQSKLEVFKKGVSEATNLLGLELYRKTAEKEKGEYLKVFKAKELLLKNKADNVPLNDNADLQSKIDALKEKRAKSEKGTNERIAEIEKEIEAATKLLEELETKESTDSNKIAIIDFTKLINALTTFVTRLKAGLTDVNVLLKNEAYDEFINKIELLYLQRFPDNNGLLDKSGGALLTEVQNTTTKKGIDAYISALTTLYIKSKLNKLGKPDVAELAVKDTIALFTKAKSKEFKNGVTKEEIEKLMKAEFKAQMQIYDNSLKEAIDKRKNEDVIINSKQESETVGGFVPVAIHFLHNNQDNLTESELSILKALQEVKYGDKVVLKKGTYNKQDTVDVYLNDVKIGNLLPPSVIEKQLLLYDTFEQVVGDKKLAVLGDLRKAYKKDSAAMASISNTYGIPVSDLEQLAERTFMKEGRYLTGDLIKYFDKHHSNLQRELLINKNAFTDVLAGDVEWIASTPSKGGFKTVDKGFPVSELFDDVNTAPLIYFKKLNGVIVGIDARTGEEVNLKELGVSKTSKVEDGLLYTVTDKSLNGKPVLTSLKNKTLSGKTKTKVRAALQVLMDNSSKASKSETAEMKKALVTMGNYFYEDSDTPAAERNKHASRITNVDKARVKGKPTENANVKMTFVLEDGSSVLLWLGSDISFAAGESADAVLSIREGKGYRNIYSTDPLFEDMLNEILGKTNTNVSFNHFMENEEYASEVIENSEVKADPLRGPNNEIVSVTRHKGGGNFGFSFKVGTPATERIIGKGKQANLNQNQLRVEEISDQMAEDARAIETTSDSNFYQSKLGAFFTRVTSYFQGVLVSNPLLEASNRMGTMLDEIGRDVFSGQIKTYENYIVEGGVSPIMNEADFNAYVTQLNEFVAVLASRGETIFGGVLSNTPGQEFKLSSTVFGVAGAVDLMTYDVNGDVRIYDMKSMKGNKMNTARNRNEPVSETNNKYDTPYDEASASDKVKHQKQLSIYAAILKQQYGLNVVDMAIVPTIINYKADDYSLAKGAKLGELREEEDRGTGLFKGLSWVKPVPVQRHNFTELSEKDYKDLDETSKEAYDLENAKNKAYLANIEDGKQTENPQVIDHNKTEYIPKKKEVKENDKLEVKTPLTGNAKTDLKALHQVDKDEEYKVLKKLFKKLGSNAKLIRTVLANLNKTSDVFLEADNIKATDLYLNGGQSSYVATINDAKFTVRSYIDKDGKHVIKVTPVKEVSEEEHNIAYEIITDSAAFTKLNNTLSDLVTDYGVLDNEIQIEHDAIRKEYNLPFSYADLMVQYEALLHSENVMSTVEKSMPKQGSTFYSSDLDRVSADANVVANLEYHINNGSDIIYKEKSSAFGYVLQITSAKGTVTTTKVLIKPVKDNVTFEDTRALSKDKVWEAHQTGLTQSEYGTEAGEQPMLFEEESGKMRKMLAYVSNAFFGTNHKGLLYKYSKDKIKQQREINKANGVFLVGKIVQAGGVARQAGKNKKGEYAETIAKKTIVAGNQEVAWGSAMAINSKKPLYVYDTVTEKWYFYTNGAFAEIVGDVTLTSNFASYSSIPATKQGKETTHEAIKKVMETTKQVGSRPKADFLDFRYGAKYKGITNKKKPKKGDSTAKPETTTKPESTATTTRKKDDVITPSDLASPSKLLNLVGSGTIVDIVSIEDDFVIANIDIAGQQIELKLTHEPTSAPVSNETEVSEATEPLVQNQAAPETTAKPEKPPRKRTKPVIKGGKRGKKSSVVKEVVIPTEGVPFTNKQVSTSYSVDRSLLDFGELAGILEGTYSKAELILIDKLLHAVSKSSNPLKLIEFIRSAAFKDTMNIISDINSSKISSLDEAISRLEGTDNYDLGLALVLDNIAKQGQYQSNKGNDFISEIIATINVKRQKGKSLAYSTAELKSEASDILFDIQQTYDNRQAISDFAKEVNLTTKEKAAQESKSVMGKFVSNQTIKQNKATIQSFLTTLSDDFTDKLEHLLNGNFRELFDRRDTNVNIIIKPLALENGNQALVKEFIKKNGGKIIKSKKVIPTADQIATQYAAIANEDFFGDVVDYYTGSEIVVMDVKLNGNKLAELNALLGSTTGFAEDANSLRSQLVGTSWKNMMSKANVLDNGIHVSKTKEQGKTENEIWFNEKQGNVNKKWYNIGENLQSRSEMSEYEIKELLGATQGVYIPAQTEIDAKTDSVGKYYEDSNSAGVTVIGEVTKDNIKQLSALLLAKNISLKIDNSLAVHGVVKLKIETPEGKVLTVSMRSASNIAKTYRTPEARRVLGTNAYNTEVDKLGEKNVGYGFLFNRLRGNLAHNEFASKLLKVAETNYYTNNIKPDIKLFASLGGFETITKENIETVQKWTAEHLPNMKMDITEGLIKATDGSLNYGLSTAAGTQVSLEAPFGTAYHEALHYVADYLADPETVDNVLDIIKIQYGVNNTNEAHEILADLFRTYQITQQAPESLSEDLAELLPYMQEILAVVTDNPALETLFKDINQGAFSDTRVSQKEGRERYSSLHKAMYEIRTDGLTFEQSNATVKILTTEIINLLDKKAPYSEKLVRDLTDDDRLKSFTTEGVSYSDMTLAEIVEYESGENNDVSYENDIITILYGVMADKLDVLSEKEQDLLDAGKIEEADVVADYVDNTATVLNLLNDHLIGEHSILLDDVMYSLKKIHSYAFININDLLEEREGELERSQDYSPELVSTSKLIDRESLNDDPDTTFRPIVKQAVARLEKRQTIFNENGVPIDYESKPNIITGEKELVDFEHMFPKLIVDLVGISTFDQLIERMEDKAVIVPEYYDLIDQIENDSRLAKAMLIDLNKDLVNEVFVDINKNYSIKSKSGNTSYGFADKWAEGIKSLSKNKIKTEEVLDKYVKLMDEALTETDPSLRLKTLARAVNTLGINITYEELVHMATDPSNVDGTVMDAGLNKNKYPRLKGSSYDLKVSLVVNKFKVNLNSVYNYLAKTQTSKKVVEFTEYKRLNLVGNVKAKYGKEGIKLSYLDVKGNQKNQVNKISPNSKFFNTLKNGTDAEVLDFLLEKAEDPSMEFSNLLFGQTGLLKELTDKEGNTKTILNKPVIDNFKSFLIGGVRNNESNVSDTYKGGSNQNWLMQKIALYLNGVPEESDVRILTGIIPGDASNNFAYSTTVVPLDVMSIKDDGTINYGKNEDLKLALFNAFLQEQSRMVAAKRTLFDIDENGMPQLKTIIDENGDKQVDTDFYDNGGFVQNYHFALDKNNNRIFLDEHGKPTGAAFKFHNFTSLNELINPVTGLFDGYSGNLLNGAETVHAYVMDKVFEEFQDDFNNIEADYYDIMENAGKELVNEGLIDHTILSMIIHERLFNIEIQNMFTGLTSEFEVKKGEDGSYNVSDKGLSQVIVRHKQFYQAGTAGKLLNSDMVEINPNVSIAVSQNAIRHSTALQMQTDLITEQLIQDGYTLGTPDYIKKYNSIRESMLYIDAADGAGYMTLNRWAELQDSQGRWSEFEHLFEEPTARDDGRYDYKLKDNLKLSDMLRIIDVVKPVYSSRTIHEAAGKKMLKQEYIKYASFPLIDQFVKNNPELKALKDTMERNNIDEFIFASAEKQGATELNKMFDDEGHLLDNLDDDGFIKVDYVKQTSFDDYRIQLEITAHSQDSANKMGVQNQKSIIANIDKDKVYASILDSNGDAMTGRAIIDKHFNILSDLIGTDYINTMYKLSLKSNLTGIEIEDIKAISTIMLQELQRNGISKDTLSLLATENNQFVHNLDSSDSVGKMVAIINSQFTNNIKNTKMNGSHLTLIPDVMIRPNAFVSAAVFSRNLKNLGLPVDNMDDYNELKVRYVGGKIIADILIPAPSKDYLNDDGTPIDIDLIDPELLRVMGYRIPSTGKHSNVVFNVVGFTPHVAGAVIVTPSDFVGRTGWDFDVDSVYMMFRNHQPAPKNSKYKYVKMTDNTYKEYRTHKLDESSKYVANTEESKAYRLATTAVRKQQKIVKQAEEELKRVYKRLLADLPLHLGSFDSLKNNVDKARFKKALIDLSNLEEDYKGFKHKQTVNEDGTPKKGTLEIDVMLTKERMKYFKTINKELTKLSNSVNIANSMLKLDLKPKLKVASENYQALLETSGLLKTKAEYLKTKAKSRKVLENEIFDLWEAIQTSPEHLIESMMPSSMDTNIASRDGTRKITEKNDHVSNNPISSTYQNEIQVQAVTDKDSLAIFANIGSMLNIHQVVQSTVPVIDVDMTRDDLNLGDTIKDDFGDDVLEKGKTVPNTKRDEIAARIIRDYVVTYEALNEATGEYQSKLVETIEELYIGLDEMGSVSVQHDRLGASSKGAFDNIAGMSITQMVGEDIDNAADAIKVNLIDGINTYTKDVYSLLKSVGTKTNYAALFINQPILKEINKAQQRAERADVNESKNLVVGNTIKKYVNRYMELEPNTLNNVIDELKEKLSNTKDETVVKRLSADIGAINKFKKLLERAAFAESKYKKPTLTIAKVMDTMSSKVKNLVWEHIASEEVITESSLKNNLFNDNDNSVKTVESEKNSISTQAAIYNKFSNVSDIARAVLKLNTVMNVDKKSIGVDSNETYIALAKIKELHESDAAIQIATVSGGMAIDRIFPKLTSYMDIANIIQSDIYKDNVNRDVDSQTEKFGRLKRRIKRILDRQFDKSIYPLLEEKLIKANVPSMELLSKLMLTENYQLRNNTTGKLYEFLKDINFKDEDIIREQKAMTGYTKAFFSGDVIKRMAKDLYTDSAGNALDRGDVAIDLYNEIKTILDTADIGEYSFLRYVDIFDALDHEGLRVNRLKMLPTTVAEVDEIKAHIDLTYDSGDSRIRDILLKLIAMSYETNGLNFDRNGLSSFATTHIKEDLGILNALDSAKDLLSKPEAYVLNGKFSKYIYDTFLYKKITDDRYAPKLYPSKVTEKFVITPSEQANDIRDSYTISKWELNKKLPMNAMFFKMMDKAYIPKKPGEAATANTYQAFELVEITDRTYVYKKVLDEDVQNPSKHYLTASESGSLVSILANSAVNIHIPTQAEELLLVNLPYNKDLNMSMSEQGAINFNQSKQHAIEANQGVVLKEDMMDMELSAFVTVDLMQTTEESTETTEEPTELTDTEDIDNTNCPF